MRLIEAALGATLAVTAVDQVTAALGRSLPGVVAPPLYAIAAGAIVTDRSEWRQILAAGGLALCLTTALDLVFDLQTSLRTKVVRGMRGPL